MDSPVDLVFSPSLMVVSLSVGSGGGFLFSLSLDGFLPTIDCDDLLLGLIVTSFNLVSMVSSLDTSIFFIFFSTITGSKSIESSGIDPIVASNFDKPSKLKFEFNLEESKRFVSIVKSESVESL